MATKTLHPATSNYAECYTVATCINKRQEIPN